jgi:hypothetical protein
LASLFKPAWRLLHRSTLLGIPAICLGAIFPASVVAAPSKLCPALGATIAKGGSAKINVSHCDGSFDGGMSGPIAPFAKGGTVTIGKNAAGKQFVVYKHKGKPGNSDVFYLEDNDLGVVTVKITIK